MSSEFCRHRARQVLEELHMVSPPVDVEVIAGAFGLAIRYVTRIGEFAGQLFRERMEIEVNKRHHGHKQRFTIAHEIGHFVLAHSSVVSPFDDRGIADPSGANERQANVFASELLMPEPWVRKRWADLPRISRTIDKMAEDFDVSSEAMYYQLEKFDLLGMPPAR